MRPCVASVRRSASYPDLQQRAGRPARQRSAIPRRGGRYPASILPDLATRTPSQSSRDCHEDVGPLQRRRITIPCLCGRRAGLRPRATEFRASPHPVSRRSGPFVNRRNDAHRGSSIPLKIGGCRTRHVTRDQRRSRRPDLAGLSSTVPRRWWGRGGSGPSSRAVDPRAHGIVSGRVHARTRETRIRCDGPREATRDCPSRRARSPPEGHRTRVQCRRGSCGRTQGWGGGESQSRAHVEDRPRRRAQLALGTSQGTAHRFRESRAATDGRAGIGTAGGLTAARAPELRVAPPGPASRLQLEFRSSQSVGASPPGH
jgi:hypothetical protein